MTFKSVLKPNESLVMGGAVMGLVFATYQGDVGSMSLSHATDASDRNLVGAKRKAGWTALAIVAGITLLAKDANIAILGGGTIIAMELCYTHAIHANPATGALQNPMPASAYAPAQNVVPIVAQGQPVAGYAN